MREIKWLSAYETGNERIDGQHQLFFSLLCKLVIDVEDEEDRERIQITFGQVMEYARIHFWDEENLMTESHYPGFAIHKMLHEDIIHRLEQYFEMYGDRQIAIKDVIEFLVNWFARHVICEDVKIANHLANRRSTSDGDAGYSVRIGRFGGGSGSLKAHGM